MGRAHCWAWNLVYGVTGRGMKSSMGLRHRMELRQTFYHLLAAPPNLYLSEAPAQDGSRKYRFGGAASKWYQPDGVPSGDEDPSNTSYNS
eukprot:7054592-Prymnesium_polylepis.1